jgi:hypothetical protein
MVHPIDITPHRLGQLANTTGGQVTLSPVEYFNIPQNAGDCIVLIQLHSGTNALGRYFPISHIDPLLLPRIRPPKSRPSTADKAATDPATSRDVVMTDTSPDSPFERTITTPRPLLFSSGAPVGRDGMEIEHTDGTVLTADGDSDDEGSDDAGSWNIMDLASFLEFAVSVAHCLETLHKAGTIHREIRSNAFHVSVHSGVVRFAHFGNRSVSLERLDGPNRSSARLKIKRPCAILHPSRQVRRRRLRRLIGLACLGCAVLDVACWSWCIAV